MIGRLKLGGITIAAALVVAPVLLLAGELAGQSTGGRYRVVIPDFFPAEGANKNFGEDVAKELRTLVNGLPRHAPVERNDIRDQLRRNDLRMEDLDCTRTRQLASLMQAEVALCATYSEQGDDRVFQSITFVDLGSSQEFPVEAFTIHKDQKRDAAQRIVDAFDLYVQQLNFRTYCLEYAQNSDWDRSLRNCDDALDLAATDKIVMYQRAFTLNEMDRADDALDQLNALLEVDPYHSDGLMLAGYLATTHGDEDAGREYYSRYLELNPGDLDVRRSIAYKLFEAGDPEGAMLLIEEGLGADTPPELAVELQGDLGSYAFEAARTAMPEGQQAGADTPLPADVEALYRKAIGAYEAVYEIRPDSMPVNQLRNVVVAYMNLSEFEQAEQFADRVLGTHSEEPTLWSVYSTVLERQEKYEEAREALAQIEAIDPDYQNLYVRQGQLMMRAGQRDQAMPLFERAVERGQDPNRVADAIFGDAYEKGLESQNPNRDLQYGIAGMEMAKSFDVNAENRAKYDFWHGYGLFEIARVAQEPNTLETARRTLPMFQEALQLFRAGRSYGEATPGIPVADLIDNAGTFIEIQEAIIERGR